MYPVLFSIGEFQVPSYGILYLIAFLASIFTFAYLATRDGLGFSRAVDVAFITAIGGEVGARTAFVLVEWDRFVSGSISLGQFVVAGRVVLGGVVAGFVTFVYLVRRWRLPVVKLADAGFTGVSLGMAIGRIGCLMGGCCYGRETDLAWGITFTNELAHRYNGTPLGVALHPTQIVQALAGFLIFGLLWWAHGRRRFYGQVAALFWVLVGLSRIFTEFLRGDPRGAAVGLSTSQWIGLAALAGGTLWLIVGFRRAARLAG